MKPKAQSLSASVGSVLEGIYRVDRLVGEGGMGTVYEAVQLRLNKRVALKVMTRELAISPEALARFHREAVVTSGIGHPHIVQVFDFSTTPMGEPFFVMEFLDGEDLDRRIRRMGQLPLASTVHVVKQVASALAAAHAKEVIHRDLKPANIRLLDLAGDAEFVKVLDFGISKVRGTAVSRLTQSTAIIGTPNYMSPEQATGLVDEVDERTDQWALACIAWECLAGVTPFRGENAPSVLFQVVHQEPPPLLKRWASGKPAVEAVLRRALSKHKEERFGSIAEFAQALAGAALAGAAGEPSGSPRSDTITDTKAPLASTDDLPRQQNPVSDTLVSQPPSVCLSHGRPRRWVAGAGVVALLLVIGAVLLWAFGPRRRSVVESIVVTPASLAPSGPTRATPPPVIPARIEVPAAPRAAR